MKLDRLIYILLTLEKEKKVTAKRLAEELETSIRTIYRDIEVLCASGIPICAESGQNGGISLMEGYRTQIKHFDKEDVIYLFLNGMGVKAERSSLLEKHTDISLKKIVKALPDTQAEEIQEVVNRFVVDRSPWWGEEQTIPQLDIILQAVFQLHKLSLTYQKRNQEAASRILRPYGIVVKEMNWYLVGYCETSKEIRMFRCDRITECKRLDETFVYPEGFRLQSYYNESLKTFKEKCALEEQYFATLVIKESALGFLKGMEYSILQREPDGWKVQVNLSGPESAVNDYWNLLMSASSVEPPELREAVKKKITSYLKKLN